MHIWGWSPFYSLLGSKGFFGLFEMEWWQTYKIWASFSTVNFFKHDWYDSWEFSTDFEVRKFEGSWAPASIALGKPPQFILFVLKGFEWFLVKKFQFTFFSILIFIFQRFFCLDSGKNCTKLRNLYYIPCIHYREWVCSVWFKTVLNQGRY